MSRPLDAKMTGLKPDTIDKIQGCLNQFPAIERVIIYGSRAKGNYRTGSDIDLCLVGEELSQEILLDLDKVLDELFLPYSFDVSIYNQIDSDGLKDHIDRVGMEFYLRN